MIVSKAVLVLFFIRTPLTKASFAAKVVTIRPILSAEHIMVKRYRLVHFGEKTSRNSSPSKIEKSQPYQYLANKSSRWL